jgi:signal transduction histidine kinase
LFEPFFGRDRLDAGDGPDLFLVRLIVEGWGGTVRGHSDPGQGNTITLTVP